MKLLIFAHRPEASAFLREYRWIESTELNRSFTNRSNGDILLLTGSGKEAVEKSLRACQALHPSINEWINLGTCGLLKKDPSFSKVIEIAQSLSPDRTSCYQLTPNANPICLTSDHPIENREFADQLSQTADVVDMELCYIAQLALEFKIKLTAIKCISDDADGSQKINSFKQQAATWSQQLLDYYREAIERRRSAE